MSQALRAAVIGVGKLGRFHCDKYFALKSQFTELEFVGVYDVSEPQRNLVAHELSQIYKQPIEAFSNLEGVAKAVDLVTIASSSHSHFELVEFFLKQKKHVLVEKPLALGLEQGQMLVSLAKHEQVTLAVGHSERFNPGYQFLKSNLRGSLKALQFVRHSPYSERVTDVSVIDDLMIHDLDLLSDLCGSNFHVVTSFGKKVRSSHFDVCDAFLQSSDESCFVTLSSQRLLPNMTRTVRVVTDQMSIIIDLQNNQIDVCHWKMGEGGGISEPSISLPKQDHLMMETREFLNQIVFGKSSFCSGESVLPSLKWRDDVLKQCNQKMF
jgi:predicted dehydrogenase